MRDMRLASACIGRLALTLGFALVSMASTSWAGGPPPSAFDTYHTLDLKLKFQAQDYKNNQYEDGKLDTFTGRSADVLAICTGQEAPLGVELALRVNCGEPDGMEIVVVNLDPFFIIRGIGGMSLIDPFIVTTKDGDIRKMNSTASGGFSCGSELGEINAWFEGPIEIDYRGYGEGITQDLICARKTDISFGHGEAFLYIPGEGEGEGAGEGEEMIDDDVIINKGFMKGMKRFITTAEGPR